MYKQILPVAIFGFNRPNKLQRILDALKTQAIDYLIIFIDGPRDIQDVKKVTACQDIAREVNWAEKELHLWDDNHGLGHLSENFDLIFKKFSRAIFVEDDCLPMPEFYSFMRQALERYENRRKCFFYRWLPTD